MLRFRILGGGGGGRGSGPPPLENHKAIGFVSNTGLGRLENHKATKPAFDIKLDTNRKSD